LLVLLAGCGPTRESGSASAHRLDQQEAGDAAPPASTTPTPTGLADLGLPDDGFQVRSQGADIGPGDDIEYCEIGELPGEATDTYYVGDVELANAEHSHHLVVATALPGSDAEVALRAMNIGDKVECNGASYQWPEDGLVFVASAQTPYIDRKFPKGVGSVLHGNQRIVFDYHYLNTGDTPVHAQSAMNVHLVDGASIEHIATAFSFFNFTVDVPPHQSGQFTAECHFKDDLMVSSLVRHTHQQGRDFSVSYSGGARDGEHIWTSHDWKEEPGYDFTPASLVKAGEGLQFECDFDNPNDTELRYGIKGTDEMCILAGWFWPAGDTRELPPQDCGITWTDSEGIGHPADEAGGFPPATSLDSMLCQEGVSLTGYGGDPTCTSCMCKSCGSVLMRCASDTDCSALIDCFGKDCGTEAECIQACKQPLHDHSSAVGMMQQVESCVSSKCAGCGPAAAGPAGD
jgi:hypothetical protein